MKKKKLCEIAKEFSDENEDSFRSPLMGSPQSSTISDDYFKSLSFGNPQSNSRSEEEKEKENLINVNNINNECPKMGNNQILYNNMNVIGKNQENEEGQNLGNFKNFQNLHDNLNKFSSSSSSFLLPKTLSRYFSTQENTLIKKTISNNNSNNLTFNNTNNNPNNFTLNNRNIFTYTNNNAVNNNNFDIKRINEENKNEGENQEINNNLPKNDLVNHQVKENTNYENRNLEVRFVKSFFKDFVIFINALIGLLKNENKNNNQDNKNEKYLEEINGNYYIPHSLMNKYNMLKNPAYDSLIFKNGLPKIFQKEENKKNQKIKSAEKKIKKNIYIIYSIFNDKNENDKKEYIIEVLKKPIFELMDIYLNRKTPKEEYYTKFPRFESYLEKNTKNENEKNNLLNVAYNYDRIIIKSINETRHKIGPKARNEIGEIITDVKDFRNE